MERLLPVWVTRVRSVSMAPTLRSGQLAWTRAYGPRETPCRGDLVVADAPDGRRVVKRLVGLPNERVELRDGRVSVDGIELAEPYASPCVFNDTFVVPEGCYLLLGDNRDASTDSRSWPTPYVARAQIKGKIRAAPRRRKASS